MSTKSSQISRSAAALMDKPELETVDFIVGGVTSVSLAGLISALGNSAETAAVTAEMESSPAAAGKLLAGAQLLMSTAASEPNPSFDAGEAAELISIVTRELGLTKAHELFEEAKALARSS